MRKISCLIGFLLMLLLGSSTTSRTIVKTLPGYPGPLPFKLETGYIGVGEDENVQIFYYFVESEGNPDEDPLIVWLAGGPGCSALQALFFEIGPLQIQYGNYRDNVPALQLEPNSWTRVANIIYLDAPTWTGFSYTKTREAARSSDTSSASQTAEFLRKFVRDHPRFVKNPMYVTGISYSGIVIPIITEEVYKGNDEGKEPILNIKGYMAGNPLSDKNGDIDSRFEYAYRMGLISHDLYKSTRKGCNGRYAEADSNDLPCMFDIDEVNKRVKGIDMQYILDPVCNTTTINLRRDVNPIRRVNERSLLANPIEMESLQLSAEDDLCRNYYDYANVWANDENVMKALNIREGTIKEWLRCNLDMQYAYEGQKPLYEFNVISNVVYHEKLSKRNCRALIYSGDHDMVVPHVGTYDWINSLNLTITDSNWDAWYVNNQIAGYVTTYARDNYSMTFATIKGAGHTAQEYKPEECFEIIKRWFAHRPI